MLPVLEVGVLELTPAILKVPEDLEWRMREPGFRTRAPERDHADAVDTSRSVVDDPDRSPAFPRGAVEDQDAAMGHVPTSRQPIAVLMSGAPGSGKSTLAVELGERLRVPVVNKDRIRQGTLWAIGSRDIDNAPPGPPLWYAVMEAHLRLGISVVGDMTLFSGVSERDVSSRLVLLADLFNVHCVARNTGDRMLERARRDPIQAHRVDWLAENVKAWNEQTESRLDLGCPHLVVDTSDGYEPKVEAIAETIAGFATSRP